MKSNNDDKHGHGQEKRNPQHFVEAKIQDQKIYIDSRTDYCFGKISKGFVIDLGSLFCTLIKLVNEFVIVLGTLC